MMSVPNDVAQRMDSLLKDLEPGTLNEDNQNNSPVKYKYPGEMTIIDHDLLSNNDNIENMPTGLLHDDVRLPEVDPFEDIEEIPIVSRFQPTPRRRRKKKKVIKEPKESFRTETLIRRPLQLPVLEDEDPEKPYKCCVEGCDWRFKRKTDLRRHLRAHEARVFHCPYAMHDKHIGATSFYRMDVFKRHMRFVHFEEVEQDKDIKYNAQRCGTCKVCGKYFENFKLFIKHIFQCALVDKYSDEINEQVEKIDLRLKGVCDEESIKLTPLEKINYILENETKQLEELTVKPSMNFATAIRLVKNTKNMVQSEEKESPAT